jgi:hypothetical protein
MSSFIRGTGTLTRGSPPAQAKRGSIGFLEQQINEDVFHINGLDSAR